MRTTRSLLGLLAAVALVVLVWWTQGDQAARDHAGGDPTPTVTQQAEPQTPTADQGGTDPESGLPWVAVGDLPPEASDTLGLIDGGGPFPHDRDGVVFHNREAILPAQPEGYYHEYTVETPGSDDRGARRIVSGSTSEFYWTDDHYASFSRIRR